MDNWIKNTSVTSRPPKGLELNDQVVVKFRNGEEDWKYHEAGDWSWDPWEGDLTVAYYRKIIK